jgi:hypothetical protein
MFDCVTYMHVPDQRRTKFDEKNKNYVFIGYNESFQTIQSKWEEDYLSQDVHVNEEIVRDYVDYKLQNPWIETLITHEKRDNSIPTLTN